MKTSDIIIIGAVIALILLLFLDRNQGYKSAEQHKQEVDSLEGVVIQKQAEVTSLEAEIARLEAEQKKEVRNVQSIIEEQKVQEKAILELNRTASVEVFDKATDSIKKNLEETRLIVVDRKEVVAVDPERIKAANVMASRYQKQLLINESLHRQVNNKDGIINHQSDIIHNYEDQIKVKDGIINLERRRNKGLKDENKQLKKDKRNLKIGFGLTAIVILVALI